MWRAPRRRMRPRPHRSRCPALVRLAAPTSFGAQRPFRLAAPAIPRPLLPAKQRQLTAVAETVAALASAGKHPDVFPEFDQREEQQQMVRAVTEAMNGGKRLLVEAGTGTGKSLA